MHNCNSGLDTGEPPTVSKRVYAIVLHTLSRAAVLNVQTDYESPLIATVMSRLRLGAELSHDHCEHCSCVGAPVAPRTAARQPGLVVNRTV
jgi:hypothetical protein